MGRYFTLDEARAILAEVRAEMGRALQLRGEMREAEEELQSVARKVMMTGGMVVDHGHLAEVRRDHEQSAGRLRAILESIQESGCLVKDLDMGLLDFPSLYMGRAVYLCWRSGEPDIAFWHGIDEGFRGRKPIDEHFVAHHSGGEEA
jgi:hypothetical protein